MKKKINHPQPSIDLFKNPAPNPWVVRTKPTLQDAIDLHLKGLLQQAHAIYAGILKEQPNNFDALHLLGVIANQTGNCKNAVELIGRAIEIHSGNPAFHSNLGNALKELKQLDAAVASYDKAIAINPNFAEAYNNRGSVLKELKQWDAAVISYDKAIAINPGSAEVHNNRGNALLELRRLDEALASFDKAVAIRPGSAEVHSNRGNALQELKRFQEALASYDKAIAIKPDYAEPYNNRGKALSELEQFDAAVASYDKAVAIKPGYADAYANRGNAQNKLEQLDAAVASYEKAFSITPDYEFLLGTLLHTRLMLCDWKNIDADSEKLKTQIEQGKKVSAPFPVFAVSDSAALQKSAAMIWCQANYPANDALDGLPQRSKSSKIRIGYYSADFHNHATSILMAHLFESHDKSKFELIAFSFGPGQNDPMRQRVSAAFDKFIDVRAMADKEVARLSRELEIDIAIDLKGFTMNSRFGIFAERCAPIQVNYLGFPGTMGADCIDYLIADKFVVPPENRPHYSENIVYLPHSYQVNDAKRLISDRVYTKQEMGLPETGFVFCCFNRSWKITPSTFDCWMRLLKQIDGSVLWLLEDNPIAAQNLRKEAEKRGVSGSRLVFTQRMPLPEHLARHRLADLFLDTLPCNAHTTASDALWAGLPVLTCMGESFASRVTGSLLNAIELPELIATSQQEYESLAIELASHSYRLAQIKAKLDKNRLNTPLFDTELFTRHIEAAYLAMYEKYHAGRSPETIPEAAISSIAG